MGRYIDREQLEPVPNADAETELLRSLERIITVYPPQAEYHPKELHGIFSGPSSIALLLFNISQKRPDMHIMGKRIDRLCHQYLNHAVPLVPVTAHRCGVGCERLAHKALTAAITQDVYAIEAFLSETTIILQTPNPPLPPASNEWLYGRAGTLYLLRFMAHHCPRSTEKIQSLIDQIIDKIMIEGPNWMWHGKMYLGAVHGSIGIISQLVLSMKKSSHQRMELWKWIESLLQLQFASGNFPSSLENSRDELVQFCHGGPGFVISLLAIRDYAPTDDVKQKINLAIQKSREDIWTRGVLYKEPCLCHGVSGNALALIEPQRSEMLRWTQGHIIEKGLKEDWMIRSSDPTGLMGGEAGRAWAWMVQIGLVHNMIGFSDM